MPDDRSAAARAAGRWRAWVVAARLPTLPAAVAPVLVGSAAAAHAGAFHPVYAGATLVVSLAIQVGTNYANDAADFLRGADTAGRLGPPRVTQLGLLDARTVLRGAYLCFGVAAAIGLIFVARYGWPVAVAGILAIAAGLAYTGGPWPFGYHGLGELFVFVFFGMVAVAGTSYVQVGGLTALALAAAVPVGLLCSAILVANNLRDIDTDRAAGKRTLAVRIGPGATRVLYLGCLAGAAAAPPLMRWAGLTGGWFWLPWLAVPEMLALGHIVWRRRDGPALVAALKRTARLHLGYGMLLAVSLLR
jgi:1,4-dihydroxy-2-naphthoate octaprenyltransferase